MVVLLFWASPLMLFGQANHEPGSTDRRARRAYERAEEAINRFDYPGAIVLLGQALSRDPEFIEAHLLIADAYAQQGELENSIPHLEQAIRIDSLFYPPALYYLGEAYFNTGNYALARSRLQSYLQLEVTSDKLSEQSAGLLRHCEFALHAIQHPVPFDPQNPGPSINTSFAEYSPALTADEQTLIFTRKKPRERRSSGMRQDYYEDFYISYFRDGTWTAAENLGPPLNTLGNEGAQTITADGKHLYFTACNRPDGIGSCDIYYSRQEGGRWSVPENLGHPVNSPAWDSQPSVSADGNTLYFASSRSGSFGPSDIWKTTRNEDGTWNIPENMGTVINTRKGEMSPFIHPDNQTLYFASEGHPGMGGLDIFFTRRDEQGSWSEVVNLGYPINTHGDEFALIVGASGETAWFASDKEGGYGDSDLYYFRLYEEARPTPVTYMKGIVSNADTGYPLGADFELIDVERGLVLLSASADAVDGSFLVPIPTGRNMALHVSKEGYLFFSENFSYEDLRTTAEPHLRDIILEPVKVGVAVVLRNVFFDTDSYTLKKASVHELIRLLDLMENNPEIHIEIGGHTDSTGSYAYNKVLSENRARSVRAFLLANGVSPERITYVGYGDTRPVDTNETEEGRANNRRTEFKIIRPNE